VGVVEFKMAVIWKKAPHIAVLVGAAPASRPLQPSFVRDLESIGNNRAWNDECFWKSTNIVRKRQKDIEQASSPDALVLCFHVPAAVSAALASGLNLDCASAVADVISYDDICGRYAYRRERGDQPAAQ